MLNPSLKQEGKKRTSSIMIIFERINNEFIVVDDNSQLFYGQKKSICLFFPQFYQVFYFDHIKQKETKKSLEKFTKQRLKMTNFPGIKMDQDAMIFKNFSKQDDVIIQTSPVSWYRHIKVQFLKEMEPIPIQRDTFLKIKIHLQSQIQVCYNQFKKFHLAEIFYYQKLDKISFTSLKVKNQILKHYQSLQLLNLQPGIHYGQPLFAFQTFYKEAQDTYEKITEEKIDVQMLVKKIGKNQQQNNYIEQFYKKIMSESIDKLTHYIIIYLTSPFYHIPQQKKLLTDYFNRKLEKRQNNTQFMMKMCLMLNRMVNYQSFDHSKIYIAEKKAQQQYYFSKGQIVRINTFTPAVSQINHLNLKGQESYCIYEIDHISAKHVTRYNCQQYGFTHIILPYNQYIVQEVTTRGKNDYVKIHEFASPKRLNSSLIIWIIDNLKTFRPFKNHLVSDKIQYQIMFIKNAQLFESWLKRYYVIINSRDSCIIYNNESIDEGLHVVGLTQKYFGKDKEVMIYLDKSLDALEQVENTKSVYITTSQMNIYSYINECLGNKNNEDRILCSRKCTCNIY